MYKTFKIPNSTRGVLEKDFEVVYWVNTVEAYRSWSCHRRVPVAGSELDFEGWKIWKYKVVNAMRSNDKEQIHFCGA